MDYIRLVLTCTPENGEILTAYLGEMGCDMFEDTETGIHAYITATDYTPDVARLIADTCAEYGTPCEVQHVPAQNWNETWESNFQPVVVGSFCGVRATFHPPITTTQFELVINPKMAFGTGHHETTYMMMEAMEHLPLAHKSVLDFGAGTGILAILAAKLGATHADAVDNEEPAYEGIQENAVLNAVQGVHAYFGSLEQVPTRKYHVVLANINRNVLLQYMQQIADRMLPDATLLLSGFYEEDIPLLAAEAAQYGIELTHTYQRDKWRCLCGHLVSR